MRWNDKQPIYQQLRDKIVAAIMDGSYAEGDMIPSIRQISSDYQINPLTVSKAYQGLVADQVIEKRRGMGMIVKKGAQKNLSASEKKQFLKTEWPDIKKKIQSLSIDIEELLK